MFDNHFQFPSLLFPETPVKDGRIAVVGAGVSGLACAYELQRRGFDVVVYEQASRPGGRVQTHRFWDGTSVELGAMRIPNNHHCTLHYVNEFGLKTRPFINFNPDSYYFLRGRRARIGDPGRLYSAFELRDTERRDPLQLLDALLRDAWERLSPAQRHSIFTAQLDDPDLDELLSTSLWQHVRRTLSPDAWELVGHASGLVHYEHSALLEVLIDYFGLFHVDQVELVDGMDSLVRGFAAALRPGSLRLSTRITELALTGDGVRIHGERKNASFTDDVSYVVCCVPAPALARIDVTPDLPYRQRQAVHGISYASSTKTVAHAARRVWELDDGIFGGGSFTDLPIQQVWYPSDNARRVDQRTDGGPRWTAQDTDLSQEPVAFTAAYQWERNARRFAALPEPERTRIVLRSLEKLHPGIGAHIDDVVHWTWDEQAGIGGGAFAYLSPGEHVRYLHELAAPHPADQPRIFFAGEHLSVAHAWIQGAIQSGLDAVAHLLDRAGAVHAA
nr:NAD(P)/FAD-dependent oxidoreductase [Kibdelosporangium sp. MJ126-NF4]CEL23158.1 Tryptophan 2-monooxygenase [Kibdelosporangium sp. MJ126-NF4]CTQ90296.1 Tryptophan 2-monooxygenase (EC 1.13.12.3) [Kibdelosporangium sp. MJ126-NF4]